MAGRDGGGTTGPMSPSGATSRSTITGAWSLGPVPLRASRSIQAAATRSASRPMGGLLFCVAWPAFVLSWFDGEAEEVTPLPAQVSPLPQRPATASIAPLPFALPDRHQILEGVQRLFIPARPLLLSPSA